MARRVRQSREESSRAPRVGEAPAPALYLLDRDAARQIDRRASQEFGIPTIVLMENAAVHVAETALEELEGVRDPLLLIVCGPGNNGGDGLAVARHLSNAGVDTRIVVLGDAEDLRGDAAVQLNACRKMKLRILYTGENGVIAIDGVLTDADGKARKPQVVVDALFGTGLSRPVEGVGAELIAAMNELGRRGAHVLSVDVPSGLDANSGAALGAVVRADTTVTFVGLKPGLLSFDAQGFVGDVVVADIGAPRSLVEEVGTPVAESEPEPEPEHAPLKRGRSEDPRPRERSGPRPRSARRRDE
ncbi:MAG: NAD(P)H-hydrate epimerase [Phycisphaerales bacterium]|nr:NAD(P)H-hydrate epimerase [Phycisphaerales bacterium]